MTRGPFAIGFYFLVPSNTHVIAAAPALSRGWFRGERLIVPCHLATEFTLEGMTVDGATVESAWQGPIPGVVMSEAAPPFLVETGWFTKGQIVGIRVINLSPGSRTFRAALIGTAEDSEPIFYVPASRAEKKPVPFEQGSHQDVLSAVAGRIESEARTWDLDVDDTVARHLAIAALATDRVLIKTKED